MNYYLDNDVNMVYVCNIFVKKNVYEHCFKYIIMINILNDIIKKQL